jgi:GMP synthase-like glutamine amidotransferase
MPVDFDACILTGDMHNVTDGLEKYHVAELGLVDRLQGRKLIAHHFGGKVVRREARLLGWETARLAGDHPTVAGIDSFEAVCMNVDEVAEEPERASVLGSSAGCAFHVLAYGDNILTCQSHPEFGFRQGSWMVKAVAMALAKGPGEGYRRFRESGPAVWPEDNAFMRGVIDWLLD